ncbi:hypothetical protein CHUAL_008521 [Chamberlinius hualienensis]
MASVKATLSDPTAYHHASHQHHLSKVFNPYAIDDRLHLSIDSDIGRRWTPIINGQSISSSDGIPIDLSNKRSSKLIGYVCDGDMALANKEIGGRDKKNTANGYFDNGDEDDISDGNVNGSEEPLNLSTSNKTANCQPTKKSMVDKEMSPDRIQKKERLEEMVTNLRKSSNIDGSKLRLLSGASENGNGNGNGNGRHRRKRRVTYRGGNGRHLLRLPYANGSADGLHQIQQQRTYPVLRQQLLQTVSRNGEDDEELNDSDDHSNIEDDQDIIDDIVSPLHRRLNLGNGANLLDSQVAPIVPPGQQWQALALYANLFSHPAVAQGLLMTTNANNSDEILVRNNIDGVQQHQLQTNDSNINTNNTNNPNGATANGILRKRAPRALTGKHVKHGTGASPSTLLTLRQKIEQKMKTKTESVGLNGNHQENGNKNGRRVVVSKRANKRKA